MSDQTKLSIYDLSFLEFSKTKIHWAEDRLRLRDSLGLYFLDFELLPWTVAILASPIGWVFGSVPRSSYGAAEPAIDVGPCQMAWTQQFFLEKNTLSKFRKELRNHGLIDKNIPFGLLPYDGGLLNPSPVGFNVGERPLNELWFRTYLIPRAEYSRESIARALSCLWRERGRFFLRPFEDALLNEMDWESRFMGVDEHDEAILFRNFYGGPTSSRDQKKQIEKLENFLKNIEIGGNINFLSMSPNFDDFALLIDYLPSMNFISDYDAMNNNQRNVDIVNALRSRLVRKLGWPVFINSVRTARLRAIERFMKGPKPPPGLLPFDAIVEMDLFLKDAMEKYPSYWGRSWDDIWKIEK